MSLALRELGRVAVAQTAPHQYVQRRDEELHLREDHRFHATVRQQIIMPAHGTEEPGPQRLLVPIGYFTKRFMADLTVRDGNGAEMPVLSRRDRGLAIALLFTSPWQREFSKGLTPADKPAADLFWKLVNHHTALAATEQEDEAIAQANEVLEATSRWANSGAISDALRTKCRSVHQDPRFLSGLFRLASTRIILAETEGYVDRPLVVRLSFSEPFEFEERTRRLQRLLIWLGWEPVRLSRSIPNYGQAGSLWITQRLSSGVEPIRACWSDKIHDAVMPEQQSIEPDRVIVNHYPSGPLPPDSRPPALRVDAQLAPSAAFVSALALAGVLWFVSTYIYQTPALFDTESGRGDGAQQSFVGLAGAFAALPAALAGALAYNGEAFSRLMTRGPKTLLASLAAFAALLAVVVGLQRDPGLVCGSAYVLSVYSFLLIGAFGYLQFGPRWRKSPTSRWKSVTTPLSPAECRRNQRVTATAFLISWIALTVVFARAQHMLRYEHFLTDDFPSNVWKAWWSWFEFTEFDRGAPTP